MSGDATVGGTPLSREGAEHALLGARDELDRITTALLDLDANPGHRLLDGARLSGVTERRWNETRARMTTLWTLYDAHKRVVEDAQQIFDRRSEPDEAELVELTRLLTGPSVELTIEAPPLEQRTLLGPTSEQLTLDAVVARMNTAYEEAAEVIAAADAAWSALLPRLDAADEAWRSADGLLQALGGPEPRLDHAAEELAALRDRVRADPLSLASGGRIDTTRIDTVADEVAGLRRELDEAVRFRDTHAERLRRIEESVAAVADAELAARRLSEQVLTKIADSVLPELPDRAPGLHTRLATLRESGSWRDRASRAAELESAVDAALAEAREVRSSIDGLLTRREELRGRVEAYAVKAARLGHAEDPDVLRLHREARDLLWTAPCELRVATRAVAAYLRAIELLENGAADYG